MKIAQVTPWFFPHLGGVESHVRSLSRELATRGHQVTVVTSRHDPSLPAEESLDGFRVVRVKPRLILIRTPVTPKMRANLRNLPVDVVHAHSPPPLASHYAGTVAGERGIPYVVTYHCDVELPSAFGIFAESGFLVVGEGSLLEAMKRFANSMGVADRVRFLGRVSEENLPKVYAACDVFVLPSVSRLEAFGIVALEAMATAKPVIVADIPGVREVIEDGREGLLAEPMNARDLAEKIRRLLADPEARRVMGQRGREKVLESFGIELVTDRIENVYRAVLDGRKGTTPRP